VIGFRQKSPVPEGFPRKCDSVDLCVFVRLRYFDSILELTFLRFSKLPEEQD